MARDVGVPNRSFPVHTLEKALQVVQAIVEAGASPIDDLRARRPQEVAFAVAELDDHAADLRADQDLMGRDDIAFAFQHHFAGRSGLVVIPARFRGPGIFLGG